jgi:hypothetical protein
VLKAVNAERVPRRVDLSHDLWMRFDFVPEDEEGGSSVVRAEQLEHGTRRHGVRAVVEGQRDTACASLATRLRLTVHAALWPEHAVSRVQNQPSQGQREFERTWARMRPREPAPRDRGQAEEPEQEARYRHVSAVRT